MIKRTVTEEVYEYDEAGKLVRKVVTKTDEEDTNSYESTWKQLRDLADTTGASPCAPLPSVTTC